jgi:hypothetical protein
MANTLSLQGQGSIILGTMTVDPPSIASAAIGEATVTVTGAAVGDIVEVSPPAAGLTAGLGVVGARVSASNTIKIRICNLSGGTVDEASGTWSYCLIRA